MFNFKNPVHKLLQSKRTIGQRAADGLTKIAGSWTFIILFFLFLIFWMALNVHYFQKYNLGEPFDPYPFILLNLVLSCLAAVQAPIILMSQNREAQRDRLRAEYDYKINQKSEKLIEELTTEVASIKRMLRKK